MQHNNYKNTEIGLIPQKWEVKTLGECLNIRHGRSQKEVENSNGEYPILGTGGLMGKTNHYLYNKPSVLIGRKGTIDKPRYIDTPFWTVDTLFYTEISEEIVAKFIYYQFCQIDWYSYNEASGVPSLSAKTIANIQIPLPPLPEQQRIATALSDTDALITSLENIITKKRSIKQGAMQQLLTPKEDWEVKMLGEIASYKNGKSFEHLVDEKGKYNLITLNSINIKGKLKKEHLRVQEFDYSLEKGDLIMVLSDVAHGNFLGLSDVIPSNNMYVLNQRMGALKNLKGVVAEFLSSYINHNQSYFKLSGKGSSQQNLGKDDILKFKINLPPLSEQTRIATILSDMDSEIAALEGKLEKYKAIKQGMMQVLLTGKVRLL